MVLDYLSKNFEYWSKGYQADNVESFVFRPYGQAIKNYVENIDVVTTSRMLDWGCGQGATCLFYKNKGFQAFGIDISESDIKVCKALFPDETENFKVVSPRPIEGNLLMGGNFSLITAIQSLYYLSNNDMEIELQNLYRSMHPGAIIYATMISPLHYLVENSVEIGNGLNAVSYEGPRFKVNNYYINPTFDREHLISRFSMFEVLHTGHYSYNFRSDEGNRHHFTFIGIKN